MSHERVTSPLETRGKDIKLISAVGAGCSTFGALYAELSFLLINDVNGPTFALFCAMLACFSTAGYLVGSTMVNIARGEGRFRGPIS